MLGAQSTQVNNLNNTSADQESVKDSSEQFNSSFGQHNSSIGQLNSSRVELDISGVELETSGFQFNESISENGMEKQSNVGDKDVDEDGLAETEDRTPQQTPHTDPDWLDKFKGKIVPELIAQCSGRTQRAVKNNEVIKVLALSPHSLSL